MQDLFPLLTPADRAFLVELVTGGVRLNDGSGLRRRLAAYETEQDPAGHAAAQADLDAALEREVRYLGSADLAYAYRALTGRPPGVPFSEVIRDVAGALRVDVPRVGTDRERVEAVAEAYVTRTFADLDPEAQRTMLTELGVADDKAAAFLKRSAGVFSVPLLIQAFGTIVVDGLIKRVVFGAIARIVGARLSGQLFRFMASRFPWWLRWVGPAAWTASIGWTVFDLQGPAYRKTIPVVLYLGLCGLRDRHGVPVDGEVPAT